MITSIEFANDYFSSRLYSEAWDTADESTQKMALNSASDLIEAMFEWKPCAYSVGQDGVRGFSEKIQTAVCLQAAYLMNNNPFEYPSALTKGISKGQVGTINATFSKDFVTPMIAPGVMDMIGECGVLISKKLSDEKSMGCVRSCGLKI